MSVWYEDRCFLISDFQITGIKERTIMKRNVMRIMSLAFAGIMAAGALTACGGNNTAARGSRTPH